MDRFGEIGNARPIDTCGIEIQARHVGALKKGAAQVRAACIRLTQCRPGEIGAGKLGVPQVRAGEIGVREISAAEIRGFERRAHEAHGLVLFVGAAIGVFESGARKMRAGQVSGHARPP